MVNWNLIWTQALTECLNLFTIFSFPFLFFSLDVNDDDDAPADLLGGLLFLSFFQISRPGPNARSPLKMIQFVT